MEFFPFRYVYFVADSTPSRMVPLFLSDPRLAGKPGRAAWLCLPFPLLVLSSRNTFAGVPPLAFYSSSAPSVAGGCSVIGNPDLYFMGAPPLASFFNFLFFPFLATLFLFGRDIR